MDWLRDFTKNWNLKTSFTLYMISSLFLSLPSGIIFQSILEDSRKKYILAHALEKGENIIQKFIYSKSLGAIIEILPILFVILFLYLFFQLFYRHKIQSIMNFLDNVDEVDLDGKNELSDKIFQLIQENLKFKGENFMNIRKTHEILQYVDTLLHEIKNPLTTLGGDLEMLSTVIKDDDKAKCIILSRMIRSEERIEEYINQIGATQDIKDMVLEIKEINLNDFMENIQSELNLCNHKVEFTHNLNLDQMIMLDLKLFLEGVVNILKNSDRFAKHQISVNIFENDTNIILEIQDDGPGFSQDALKNYKKPYFSENPLVGNMGLGLYITDQIMKKMDIDMILSNESGACARLFIKKS